MGNVKGSLIIGGSTIPGEYILPEYIARFKKGYPNIAVTLRLGDTQDIINLLIDGNIEMGIVGSRTDDKRIDRREFLNDELILVASPKHLKNYKKQMDIKDLRKLPFIIREKGSGSRKTLEETLKDVGINVEDLNIAAEVGSTEAVKQSVRAGIGVSFLSRIAVKDEIPNKTLVEISIKHLDISRHFYIVTNNTRALSPICQAFIKDLSAPL